MTIYAALLAELNTDVMGMGYSALVGQDATIAALMNQTTGPGAGTVFYTNVTVQQLMYSLASLADWDLLVTPGASYNSLQMLAMMEPLDCSKSSIQALLTHVFAGLSAGSKTALAAAVQRSGSRAEVLFGVGTVIQASDIAKAHGRVG